jgi:hypothetical protein
MIHNMADDLALQPISPSTKKWIIVSAVIGYIVLIFFLFFIGIGGVAGNKTCREEETNKANKRKKSG